MALKFLTHHQLSQKAFQANHSKAHTPKQFYSQYISIYTNYGSRIVKATFATLMVQEAHHTIKTPLL